MYVAVDVCSVGVIGCRMLLLEVVWFFCKTRAIRKVFIKTACVDMDVETGSSLVLQVLHYCIGVAGARASGSMTIHISRSGNSARELR